jgi:hypothetical protein
MWATGDELRGVLALLLSASLAVMKIGKIRSRRHDGRSGRQKDVCIRRRIAGSCRGNPGISGYGIIVTPIGLSFDSEQEFAGLHWTKAAMLASCQLPCRIASDCPVLTLNGGGLNEM